MYSWWGVKFVLRCLMGGRMTWDGLPSPGTGCSGTEVGNIYSAWDKWYMRYSFRSYPHHHDVSVYGPSFRKTDWKVTMGLLHVKFAYLTKENYQQCSRLSNWFTMPCLEPRVKQLPPKWWSTFRFMFLIDSTCRCVVLYSGEEFSLLHCLYSHYLSFSSQMKMFYTKYFRLLYSIDIVSTLSYMNAGNTCSVV